MFYAKDIRMMWEMADYYQRLELEEMYPWITQEGWDAQTLAETLSCIDFTRFTDDEEEE